MFNIAENLKKEMKKKKLTYRELSIKSGVSIGIISEISQCKVSNPKIITVYKIANALGITIDELIGAGRIN